MIGAMSSPQLLVPTAMVPMSPQIGSLVGDDHEVEGSRGDRPIASRTEVFLDRLIGLDGSDSYAEKIAHAITASMARMATTTMMMSTMVLSCCRNGLKPTDQTVTGIRACLRSRS